MLASVASLFVLSFAVSLDGFGVGITYGIRKIRIPVKSVAIIACCSGVVILLSLLAGTWLTRWLPGGGGAAAGAVILIGIGIWALMQFLRGNDREQTETPITRTPPDAAESTVWTLELRPFGLMVQILRTPSAADMDRSGIITAGEALLLGAALSLDAFGAGIGAGLAGYPPAVTAIVIAAASGSFLWLGTKVGFKAAGWRWVRQLTVLPAILLILMGLFKLL
jgi:putative sporulation protein YtaF